MVIFPVTLSDFEGYFRYVKPRKSYKVDCCRCGLSIGFVIRGLTPVRGMAA